MTSYLLLLAGLLGALLAIWIPQAWRRTKMRRRFRRAREGELEAAALLRRRGYRVLDDQVKRSGHMFVDGERVEYEVRADLLVSRWWRTYVVEVKTGKSAPNPKNSATRRQLREYAAVYEVDGLILADMSEGELRSVRFPGRGQRRRARVMAAMFVVGAMLGVAASAAIGL